MIPTDQVTSQDSPTKFDALAAQIKSWGAELGFNQLGITDIDLAEHPQHLQEWLAKNFHGEMDYMLRHGDKRAHPAELIPGTLRVISARLDYLRIPATSLDREQDPAQGIVSRYALGRDYHKLMRKRLATLANRIQTNIEGGEFRAFVDSAPVLERALAEKAGLGWIGKNTMLMSRHAGSFFFLGEIYTNLPLPVDHPQNTNHCGTCRACLDVCPTNAFVEPYKLDARKCISYLTIELKGSIPEELRPMMGNRIFGCDECQTVCPWNRFAQFSDEADFQPRHGLDDSQLIDLFNWTEEEFLQRTEGAAIRRTGWIGWLRNIAVALGNAHASPEILAALRNRLDHPAPLVREHTRWALDQHLG